MSDIHEIFKLRQQLIENMSPLLEIQLQTQQFFLDNFSKSSNMEIFSKSLIETQNSLIKIFEPFIETRNTLLSSLNSFIESSAFKEFTNDYLALAKQLNGFINSSLYNTQINSIINTFDMLVDELKNENDLIIDNNINTSLPNDANFDTYEEHLSILKDSVSSNKTEKLNFDTWFYRIMAIINLIFLMYSAFKPSEITSVVNALEKINSNLEQIIELESQK